MQETQEVSVDGQTFQVLFEVSTEPGYFPCMGCSSSMQMTHTKSTPLTVTGNGDKAVEPRDPRWQIAVDKATALQNVRHNFPGLGGAGGILCEWCNPG